MHEISRREFCGKAAASLAVAGVLSASERELFANPLGLPIGSQTYPFRKRIIDGDFAGLCKDMKAIDITSVELCSPDYVEFANLKDAKQVRKILDDHGLKCPSAHFTLDGLRNHHSEMIDWAKEIGMTQMSTSSLYDVHGQTGDSAQMHNGKNTLDGVKRAADDYNKIAARSAKAGLQQVLHDEDYEMTKIEGTDQLTYVALLELLDPKLVKMQFQISAMRIVGDPVMYFNKYPGRFISMHCQGVDLNAPVRQPRIPGTPQTGGGSPGVAVGKDSLDWPKIFTAAKVGGLKNYFVEQNWDLTVQSVAYLKTLKV
jgi:sugar phosphate isomerase/epimerase